MTHIRLIAVLLGLFWLAGSGAAWSAAAPAPAAGVPTVTAVSDGVLISWQLPDFSQQPGQPLTLPGYEPDAAPGDYLLPQYSILLAVPPDAAPTLSVELVEQQTALTAELPISPAPQGVLRSDNAEAIGGAFAPVVGAAPITPPAAQLIEAGTVRGVRLVRVVLHPLRPIGETLHAAVQGQIHLRFNAPPASTAVPLSAAAQQDPILHALLGQVANPAQAQVRPFIPPAQQIAEPAANPPTAAIEVAAAGITAVTYEQLAAAGFPLNSVNPAHLKLSHAGVEVAIELAQTGVDNGKFEPGERFYFYADPRFSRWQRSDVYLLTTDGSGPRLRIGGVNGVPGSLANGRLRLTHLAEENRLYTPDCLCHHLPLGRDGDRWVWDDLRQPGRPSRSYAIDLPTVDNSQPAALTVWLIGFTSLNHKVEVTLNGELLGSKEWDGKTAVSHTFPIPSGTLQTENTLTLTIPARPDVPVDGVWLDAVEIAYERGTAAVENSVQFRGEASPRKYAVRLANTAGARVYDVTNPAAPQKVNGWTQSGSTLTFGDAAGGERLFTVANGSGVQTPVAVRLRQTPQTANRTAVDYLIITHPAFAPALQPLVALRQSQGLAVAVEYVQPIYDTYGDGRMDPAAIRAFLTEAYGRWRPTYVLLAGDGTFDPKKYRADSQTTWIPPNLQNVDPWIGEVPADNRYVTVDGNDPLPDMLIGRLPVNTLAETTAVVQKIVGYETGAPLGDWRASSTFVADNTDSAGNFASHSTRLIDAYVSTPRTAYPVYYDGNGASVSATAAAVFNRWQQGNTLIVYNGHSSVHQWAGERLFHIDDVARLQNANRLPVTLQMTCFTASFHMPGLHGLDEALLRHPGGGSVAVWGSTGLGVATGHEALAKGFLDSLLIVEEPTLGAAALSGKVRLMTEKSMHSDLLDTFTLLGDPATRFLLEIRPEARLFLPLVRSSN